MVMLKKPAKPRTFSEEELEAVKAFAYVENPREIRRRLLMLKACAAELLELRKENEAMSAQLLDMAKENIRLNKEIEREV